MCTKVISPVCLQAAPSLYNIREAIYLVKRWLLLLSNIRYYRLNEATYGQNKHAHANLRRIPGQGKAVWVFWGLTQPRKLRAVVGLSRQHGDLRTSVRQILASKGD